MESPQTFNGDNPTFSEKPGAFPDGVLNIQGAALSIMEGHPGTALPTGIGLGMKTPIQRIMEFF
jgi:hypothetical protein